MKIGFVGCGKLGLMVALAVESKGHEVKGYDISPAPAAYLKSRAIPFKETRSEELLAKTKMEMVSLNKLCDWADMLFLAIQTPHGPEYEGITPLPETREDFDYNHLIAAVQDVDAALQSPKTCVVISTVLPGTIERDILPRISANFRLVYEPLFIAMGTVVEDFLNPEFVLVGQSNLESSFELRRFYTTIHDKPLLFTDIRTSEGIKVLYNTFITAKTVLGNLYGEMSHKLGMNVDDIYKAICLSTDRLLSPKYLKAGMGDGGGCHPRDNIALSFIARKIGLSYDFFESLMMAREKHCEFLADIVEEKRGDLPVIILGTSFKPETNIDTGSPALLLSGLLFRRGIKNHQLNCITTPQIIGLYFIGCRNEKYREIKFPPGSVVIDPFRYLEEQEGVKLIQIGKTYGQVRDYRTVQSTD